MIRSIQNDPKNSYPSPIDPIERCIGAGLITRVFADATHPITGLMYGGIAGGINYALAGLSGYTNFDQLHSSAKKPYVDLLRDTVAWCSSAVIMNIAFQHLNKPILRINPLLAFGAAFGTEFLRDRMDN